MLTPLEVFYSCSGSRDLTLSKVLEAIKPQGIIQIGAIQCFRKDYRIHSGWSEVFWYNYLAENLHNNLGHLVIVDISAEALKNSYTILTECSQKANYKNLSENIEFIQKPGEVYLQQCILKPDFSYLLYLDGSDDPQEMLLQFQYGRKLVKNILCDDWKIKGTKLEKFLQEENIDFQYYNVENGMAMIPLG